MKHSKLNVEKLEGVVATIFEAVKKFFNYTFLYKTSFFKLLWFVEKHAKNERGNQIANLSFIHYYYGPIPKGGKNDEGIFLEYLKKRI
ncbi:type II toxin-antitoxin system antitoxin SocA domain-containing protein [Marinitoga sp. 1155]|uniref:type II toxin-antitoxin system antitoxin SocA domain-containing protein n=1 Tax=Marinitoga sp. 1155 TaxID=1428448 RepID=UPI0018CC82CC|nr:type II toxin-antitoxin system antitoxin SocA domain-containing protein [Marinitoga sp. 1155]